LQAKYYGFKGSGVQGSKVQGVRVQGFRVQRFRGSGFKGSRFSAASGLKNGQSNRKRNFEKANTRLPCIMRHVSVIIDLNIKWLYLPHTGL
jgi:hypothetical protein